MIPDTTDATPAGSGDPAKPKKIGKREPWTCRFCGAELLVKDNCRREPCIQKYDAARAAMGLSKAAR